MSIDDPNMDRNKDGCGPSCEKHQYSSIRCGSCRHCGGQFMAAKWYTKEEAAEIKKKSHEDKMRQEERKNLKKQEEERKDEAKKNPTRVVLRDRFAKGNTTFNKQSQSAVYQAERKAAMSEDAKIRAKEKDKIRKRESRKEESIIWKDCETTDNWKLLVASRTALCRHKKDEEKVKEANEKAKLGMQVCMKRKKEAVASEDGHWYISRKKRMNPIARKNVRRVLRYIKETNTSEELIYYFNEEKQEWLYMNPFGVHYRKLHHDMAHVDDDDDYEIVDLVIKDYMDLLVINNSSK